MLKIQEASASELLKLYKIFNKIEFQAMWYGLF